MKLGRPRLEAGAAREEHAAVHGSATPPVDCPPLAAARVTVYARTLHRACELLGGLDALSAELGAPAANLTRWIGGVEPPPLDIFLAAVDIVLLGAEAGAGRC